MAQMVGADVAALRKLAYQFDQSADRLRNQAGQVTNGIQIAAWVGPVAGRFRIDWDSTHSVSLKSAAEALKANADVLRKQAAEQERASASDTGSSAAGSGHSRNGGDPNAVRFGELKPADMVLFAHDSYGNGDATLPPGWSKLSDSELRGLGIDPSTLKTPSGLDARIYTDGDGNYVLAFAGTVPRDLRGDMLENARSVVDAGSRYAAVMGGPGVWAAYSVRGALLPSGGGSTQEAMDLALKLEGQVGADNMKIAGHSLGGRHAAAASLVTGAESTTFNSAGVTDGDYAYAKKKLGSSLSIPQRMVTTGPAAGWGLDSSNITNYRTSNDWLTPMQEISPLFDAIGTQVDIKIEGKPGSGHGIANFHGKL